MHVLLQGSFFARIGFSLGHQPIVDCGILAVWGISAQVVLEDLTRAYITFARPSWLYHIPVLLGTRLPHAIFAHFFTAYRMPFSPISLPHGLLAGSNKLDWTTDLPQHVIFPCSLATQHLTAFGK